MTSTPTEKGGVFTDGKRIRASVICVNDDWKVLMMRSKDLMNLKIPGGGYEHHNGNIVHTAMRELKEEVGVHCRILTQVGLFTEHKTVTTLFIAKFISVDWKERNFEFLDLGTVLTSPLLKDETRRYFSAYVAYLAKKQRDIDRALLDTWNDKLVIGVAEKMEEMNIIPSLVKYRPAFAAQVKFKRLSVAAGDKIRLSDITEGPKSIDWPSCKHSLYTVMIMDLDVQKCSEYLILLTLDMRGSEIQEGKQSIPFDTATGNFGSGVHRFVCWIWRQNISLKHDLINTKGFRRHKWNTEKFLQEHPLIAELEAATYFLVQNE